MFENCKKVEKTIGNRHVTFQSVNTTNTGVIYERGDGFVYLISYYTCVAVYDIAKRAMYRTWLGYTPTTAKHVGLFCKYINEKYNDGLHAFTYYDWKNCHSNALDKQEYAWLSGVVEETRFRIQYKR